MDKIIFKPFLADFLASFHGKKLNTEKLFYLCLFGGWFGLHRFAAGKKLSGFLQLLSLGGFGIWVLYDLYLIILNKFTDISGNIIYFSMQEGDRANFTIRLIAFVIDAAIINAIGYGSLFIIENKYELIIAANFYSHIILFDLGFYLFYVCFFSCIYAATPGKMLMHLKIESLEGGKPTILQIFVRYFGYFISQMLVMIGFIMVIFRKDKMALHDIIAETKIIYIGGGTNVYT